MKKSFSNGNGNSGGGMAEGAQPQGPATMTITGVVLGENHWAKLV